MHVYLRNGKLCLNISECPALEPPQDGSVSITLGANAVEVATYSCNKGFMIRGLETRTCNSGTWTGLAPLCLANGKYVYMSTDKIKKNVECKIVNIFTHPF